MSSHRHASWFVHLRKAAVLAALLLLLACVAYVVALGPDLAALAGFGYPGVALLMLLSSSTVLLPAPGFAAVLAAGAVWNPLLVGLAAGLGAATGELSGYLLGVGGSSMLDLKEARGWQVARGWLGKHGFLAIMALAAVPNPLFDAMGLVAGSLSYPMRRFWVACVAGNSLKYCALASATSWWVNL